MVSLCLKQIVLSLFCISQVRAATYDWDAAYTKATAALAKLSNTDKANIVTGQGWEKTKCIGNTNAVASIGWPELCLQDSPLGIRFVKGTTAFPSGIQVGATWDRKLMYSRGNALGAEAKGVGVHVQLGPVAGPLGKFAKGGRGWEGFAVDPYLSGIAMAQTIQGMQDAGVQACAKHYIGNEQELNREAGTSANIPDRVNHELYLWPFADAVQAGVASVMCSFNKVNSTQACENELILQTLLKEELDFRGYVMSDWKAQHTTNGAAIAGMDMSMPGDGMGDGVFLWGTKLVSAVSSGAVTQARLDDMVTRVLAAWYLLGQDSGYPDFKFDSWNGGTGAPDVQGTHKTVARDVARDGIVLLKNTGGALPLSKPKSLALIGQDAIQNPDGINSCSDYGCNKGHLAMGWGSGTAVFPYLIAPYDAISAQAKTDGTTITLSETDDTAKAATAAKAADTAIVFVTADSGEQYITVETNIGDRNDLELWHKGVDLIKAVAAVNKKTIVVINAVGPVLLEGFIDLEGVVAVVWAGIAGQESGNGLVDVLYGSTSPNGKLPFTIAKKEADYGTTIATSLVDDFAEGLYIDYRHFDQAKIEPRFEFGFGLSYANFTYSDLATTFTDKTSATGKAAPGGQSSLYDVVATVSATITNSGTVTGAEVAQLYIGLPSSAPASPPKQLRGFEKLELKAGASGSVKFELRRKDLSYWNGGAWVVPQGTFAVSVGSSSRDIRLTGTLA